MQLPKDVIVQKPRGSVIQLWIGIGAHYKWQSLRTEVLNHKPPLLKDNELICPHTGLHESWLLSIVPLRIKEDTHWQIKHYALIKNVTAILGVLHLAKDMFGTT